MFARYRLGYQVLLVLAALEFAFAFSFGTAPLSKYLSDSGFVTRMLPAWVMLPLIWAGFVSIEIARRQVDKPFVAVRKMLFRHRYWLGRGLLFMFIVLFLARAFTSYKTAIPGYVPFYADPLLANIDLMIFGTDPWRITHALIGPTGTVVIDRIYALWFVIMMLYFGWFCFTRNQVLQLRGLLTFVFAWTILGNFVAVILSSTGPCFYEHFYHDTRFAPMMAELRAIHSNDTLLALKSMNFLIDSIGKERFGAGISAMPSLHVAIAFLCFLVAWEFGRHWWAKLLGFLFFAAILVGSVHLGWHYAVDGIVSVIVTGLIWWGSGRFVRWVEAREALQANFVRGEQGSIVMPA
jgi:PAP2 superfamily